MQFAKMNGLGNQILILDARTRPFSPTKDDVLALAAADAGLGFDQLMIIEPAKSPLADVYSAIWNADGSKVSACGNGARCVAWWAMRALGQDHLVIETDAGLLAASRAGDMSISIDMGEPKLDWQDIPMSERMDTITIELQVGPIDDPILHGPGCVSMGNPHVVFFVQDADLAPVAQVGPMIEYHPLFPERVNVGFAEIKARDHIRLRVWERGAGLTKACGTGACAALVAAVRRRLVDRKARVQVDGGDLLIEWRTSDNHVIMTGPIALEAEGQISLAQGRAI
jgi:diaminopimelate epimerase